MKKFLLLLFAVALTACDNDDKSLPNPEPAMTSDCLIVCCEGNWQSDNGQLSFFDCQTGILTNQWFREINGTKLGDAPNDILQVNDTLIAVVVSSSNIIQFIRPDGKACGATESIPNVRRACSDGKFLYATSYAHVCGDMKFEKGFVAKVDLKTKQVVATCEVGWEPEAIRIYNGRLYVANTGGYSYSENHDYETTVQVVDAETMRSLRTIDTGCANLYGEMSQAGRFLCINSCGDYYSLPARTVVFDCETDHFRTFDFPCTYNTTDGEQFYLIGSDFSYETYGYTYYIHTIDPETNEVSDKIFNETVTEKILSLDAPYCLYVSPYTGNIYFTDAKNNTTAGELYGYDPDGEPLFEPQKVYVNPSRILAISR